MNKRELIQTNIGNFICEKRKELNYTQDELAKALGITKTAVSNWENGNSLVDINYLATLSNLFSVSVDDILFPTQGKTPINEYSDITKQFQDMMLFKLKEQGACRKLLELFVDCKIQLIVV